jgi:hypothetical protein
MNPTERATLKRVLLAAHAYVVVVSSPPPAPAHKAMDAERQAFDALEEAVNAAIAAKPEATEATGDEGAWP